jgi:hypothetical protein
MTWVLMPVFRTFGLKRTIWIGGWVMRGRHSRKPIAIQSCSTRRTGNAHVLKGSVVRSNRGSRLSPVSGFPSSDQFFERGHRVNTPRRLFNEAVARASATPPIDVTPRF